jgi:L-alanine-DL-glutamate epimerase-like enolase superfamily enzyme
MDRDDKIEHIRLYRLDVPLVTPYRLSFGPQSEFHCVIARLTLDDGSVGWGEAALLPGYTDETAEQSWELANSLVADLVAGDAPAVEVLLDRLIPQKAFTATAFMSALDQARGHPVLATKGRMRLLGTVNCKPSEPEALRSEIEALLQTGYRTLKVKVGWDVDADLAAVSTIRDMVAGRALLRIDGNQGFSSDEGCRFVAALDPAGIELVEQPCDAHDWDAAVAIKKAAGVPVMLDEQIYGLDDIRRAADLGCADYIKLKLMKLGSIDRLVEGLSLIRSAGMRPILGNGVATGLGCWMEACVGAGTLDNAGEMNGFLKAKTSILRAPLAMEGDSIILDGRAIEIDEDRLASMSSSTCETGR